MLTLPGGLLYDEGKAATRRTMYRTRSSSLRLFTHVKKDTRSILSFGIYLGFKLPNRGLSSTQSILSNEVRVSAAVCRVTSGTFGLDFTVSS